MTHPLTTKTVYVEGDDDVRILQAWFPNIQFTSAGGKDKVAGRTEQHPACFGLSDRDFADDANVTAGRAPDSRLALLRRFCIENYLLEPDIIADAEREKLERYYRQQEAAVAGIAIDNIREAKLRELLEHGAADYLVLDRR